MVFDRFVYQNPNFWNCSFGWLFSCLGLAMKPFRLFLRVIKMYHIWWRILVLFLAISLSICRDLIPFSRFHHASPFKFCCLFCVNVFRAHRKSTANFLQHQRNIKSQMRCLASNFPINWQLKNGLYRSACVHVAHHVYILLRRWNFFHHGKMNVMNAISLYMRE